MITIEKLKTILLKGDLAVLKTTLKNYNINECDKFGNTILHYYLKLRTPIELSAKEVIEVFLENGAVINQPQKDKQFGNTALHLAVMEQQYEAFSYLIEKGTDVNAQNTHGNSVLSVAVFNYKKNPPLYNKMIEILLKHNANPHLTNQYNVSAHSLAHSIANADVKKFF
jgi:ankyrin repeat protein, putative